ncbi:MAG: hypothetical protein GY909_04175 [Oligoflexia bacterium]|nr:hypothetical protein [Oligoflexia bacterium]
MNLLLINAIVGGIIGGLIGGLVGFLFSKFYKGDEKKKKSIQTVIIVISIVGLSNSNILKEPIMNLLFPSHAVSQKLEKKLFANLESSPHLDAIKKMNAGEVQLYVARGMKRLSSEDKIIWNKIRISLAGHDPNLCAGFWTGSITSLMLIDAFMKLQDEEMNEFSRISARALHLEMEKGLFTNVHANAYLGALKEIATKMSQDEMIKLDSVLTAGVGAKNEDACWAMMKIMKHIDQNPKDLASQTLVDFLAQSMGRN